MSANSSLGDIVGVAAGIFVLGLIIIILFLFGLIAFYIGLPILAAWFVYFIVRKYLNSEARQERLAQQELALIYERAMEARKTFPNVETWAKQFWQRFPKGLPDGLENTALSHAMSAYRLLTYELMPPPPIANSIEGGKWKDIVAKVPKPQEAMEPWLQFIRRTIAEIPPPDPNGLPLHVLFGDVMTPHYVEDVVRMFTAQDHFDFIREGLKVNLMGVSENEDHLVWPTQCGVEFPAPIYFKDTPFMEMLDEPVDFSIPQKIRFEHCMAVGRSGHGKTTLLENMLLHDFASNRSIVVVDSQQSLIPRIIKLAALKGRNVILLDPKEKPALNIFALNQKRLSRYSDVERDQVYNHTIETFHYLFNSMIGADLYARQQNLFSNLISAMLAMPATMGRSATIEDIMKMMVDDEPYQKAIASLDEQSRNFFKNDFSSKNYTQTKDQIRYRIQALMKHNALKPYLTAVENRVDFYTELNNPEGAIILIDTNKAYMGDTASANLGRIALTLVLNAILERAGHPEDRHPTMLYIDEAGEYFDRSIDRFLVEARKQLCGITLAFQQFNQMSTDLRASAITNTAVKLMGGINSADARMIAADMHTTAEKLLEVPKLHFTCFVQGHTAQPVEVPVPVGMFEKQEQLSDEECEDFRKRNRERVCVAEPKKAKKRTATPPPEPEAKPSDTDAKTDFG